jgi:2-amino-4-hydroxy-6-hydroxymethyldihydropteridine diphosphokinase
LPPQLSSPATVYIALGSNQGDSRTLFRQTFKCLAALSIDPPSASSLWETTPVDCPPGSPLFLNAVVRIRCWSTPEQLLQQLQALERDMGRRPKTLMNEPRPIDLDIITFGDEIRNSPTLILPHPRAVIRRFVLEPLCELAPDLVLPSQTRTVQQLLRSLPPVQEACRLDEVWNR